MLREQAINFNGRVGAPMSETTLRVLIVDDYRDGADALGLLIEELGHQVLVTYSGRQALTAAETFPADLVLADLAMPDLDGLTLIKRYRRTIFARAKVIAITGHKSEDRVALALDAGFDRVLYKPVGVAALNALLASFATAGSDRQGS